MFNSFLPLLLYVRTLFEVDIQAVFFKDKHCLYIVHMQKFHPYELKF